MTVEKAFVVAPTLADYDTLIAFHGLDPGLSFWCETVEDAALDIVTNHLKGFAACMWTMAGRWHFDVEQSRVASINRRRQKQEQEAA